MNLADPKRWVRRLALTTASLVLVTACGTSSDDSLADTAPVADTAPTAVPADDDAAAFPRTVEHAMGATDIPTQPERVVVLDTGELDSVTAFGISPVGAVSAPVEDGLLDYLQADTRNTELVGTISDVNLEAVAALQPDLILSSKLRHEDIYDELSQIAPTVFTETVGVVWKDNLAVHAEALGFESEADDLLEQYEQRTAALGAALRAERGEMPSISMVRFLPGATRLYQKASFIGTVLDDVGLPRPPSQDVDDFAAEISAEQLELADADIIFSTYYGPADDTTKRELTTNPVWEKLSAVQAGNVYEVPDDHWMLGIGIRAANLVVDDLERLLLEGSIPVESASATFPVTVDHAFGQTVIDSEPTRVVAWGWGSADAAIALGVVPVAIPYQSYGGDENGVLPWIREALEERGVAIPTVLPDMQEPPFEAIAAARPDVILAVYSGITEADYALLSEIAPTVAYPAEPWATPWQDTIRIVGEALGEADAADDLLADIDARIAAAGAAHPELQGTSVAMVWGVGDTFYVYKPADARVDFTLGLGMVSAPSVEQLSTDESTFYFTLSLERLDELTSDVLVSYADTAEASATFLTSTPAQLMDQVRRGAVAEVVGTEFIAAVSPPTALSLTWGLDDYVEILAEAARVAQENPS